MQSLDVSELAELSARSGLVARVLMFITARDRSTGDPVSLGLWSGDDVQVFLISGVPRTYFGPAFINVPAIEGGVGLDIRYLRIPVSAISPDVELVLRGYELGMAQVEIHQATFSAETRQLLAEPRRIFRGFVQEAPITRGAAGTDGRGELVIASAARLLTRTPALFKSHADRRADTDRFREYGAASASRQVGWGERIVRAGESDTIPDERRVGTSRIDGP